MFAKLPVCSLATAMIFVCSTHLASIWWVTRQEDNANAAHWYIYQAMPIPIIYLGVRLFWRLIRERSDDAYSIVIGWFGLLFVLPTIHAFVFQPAVQSLRG